MSVPASWLVVALAFAALAGLYLLASFALEHIARAFQPAAEEAGKPREETEA